MAQNGWDKIVQQSPRPLATGGGNPACHPAIKRGADIGWPAKAVRCKPTCQRLFIVKQGNVCLMIVERNCRQGAALCANWFGFIRHIIGKIIRQKFMRCVRAHRLHHRPQCRQKICAVSMSHETGKLCHLAFTAR